ncbi:MAG: hypothetical protein JSS56_13005 [Proteobacteria bacterium]|nr:hypothetical protein [Pseudomonadota bacterium]
MQLHESIDTFLRTGSWNNRLSCSNPVVHENGEAWVRYDSMRIGNAHDGSGGIRIDFVWQGLPVAWERFESARMDGVRFHMLRATGRLPVAL